jgi:predicted ATPase
MVACDGAAAHARRRVVLTGGPGAGKTAVLELIRRLLGVADPVKETTPEAIEALHRDSVKVVMLTATIARRRKRSLDRSGSIRLKRTCCQIGRQPS